MILDKLIEKKDLQSYLNYRLQHLVLERDKLPYTLKDKKKIEKAYKLLSGRIFELANLKQIVQSNNIKEQSKFECSKVQYLKKIKVEHQKGVTK
jgi:predicted transcriptional regulator